MSDTAGDLRRMVSSAGVYALAAVAQRGVAFFLLPIYTRFLDPRQYGVLELLSAFSSIVFVVLMLGLPSALNKCYHRDCPTESDRRAVLATTLALGVPILVLGTLLLWVAASPIARLLIGDDAASDLVRLALVGGLLVSLTSIQLSSLRTREKAVAYSVLSLIQFIGAMSLNILLVVKFGLGVRGILWGNLGANAVALPIAILVAARGCRLAFVPGLARPLLQFGVLLIPVMLAGWIMDLSDRYLLRVLADLEEVAVYGVGYKIGMVIQIILVWPFQLAWPAVSFSISHREGHRETYSRTLTYFTAVAAFCLVGISLLGKAVVPVLVGEGFHEAHRVIPWVGLAYVFNGIHYCLSPGVHISGKTRYLPPLSGLAAGVNVVLNLVLIPRFGGLGAAWATAGAFLVLAVGTGVVGQRFYPVSYEYRRLGKVALATLAVFGLASLVQPETLWVSLLGHLMLALFGLPLLLLALRFPQPDEMEFLRWLVLRLTKRARPQAREQSQASGEEADRHS